MNMSENDFKISIPSDPTEEPTAEMPGAAPGVTLTPAARRALQEANDRREASTGRADEKPLEHNGPRGEEPTRFGDWERKGIAYDF